MSSRDSAIAGWDIGGAHLKVARLDPNGRLDLVRQLDTPLWQGLQTLDQAFAEMSAGMDFSRCRHAITMTGELVDLFADRPSGVLSLIERFKVLSGVSDFLVYAGAHGLLPADAVRDNLGAIASANWHASACHVARRHAGALFIDIGSTTTDIVAIRDGRPDNRGYTDGERLQQEELIYSGVVRTPVMALVSSVPFGGEWQRLAAEHFASAGDVYRLTADLSGPAAGFRTADGRGGDAADCARRLARMLGRDADACELEPWHALARFIARAHRHSIARAVERILSRAGYSNHLPFVGAGVGRFMVERLAREMGHPYIDYSALVEGPEEIRQAAADCAPASALAYLYWYRREARA